MGVDDKKRTVSRRKFIKGGFAAAAGASTMTLSGCAYDGTLIDEYPVVPENSVALPRNGKSVLVLGGGFGGLHAACELLDRGFEVTVLEKSSFLGGKLKSWREPEFGTGPKNVPPGWQGYARDAGIHGVWGCYNNLREFMGRHGFQLYKFPNETISFYNFLDKDGTNATMLQPPPDWPGTLGNLQRYLDMVNAMEEMSGEKIGLAKYLLKMMSFDFEDEKQRQYLDSITFPDWARAVGMPEKVIHRIMGPFTDMAMFDNVNETSALYFLVMMHLLFGSYEDMTISLFPHPVGETYIAMMKNYIAKKGGQIVYNSPVIRLNRENGRIVGALAGDSEMTTGNSYRCRVCGESFDESADVCPVCGAAASQIERFIRRDPVLHVADFYVAAMDTQGAQQVVRNSDFHGKYFENMAKLESTSVYVVDLWYSKCKSWENRFPEHWNFMPSSFNHLGFTLNWAVTGKVGGNRVVEPYVAEFQSDFVGDDITLIETQIADTEKLGSVSDEELKTLAHEELKTVFKDLPEPTDYYVNRWDTYSPQRVGYERIRPEIQSPIENLLFIGDWLKTDHLSVYMEKTVVSARLATNKLLEKTGQQQGRIKILQSGTPNRIIELCKKMFDVYT